MPPILKSLIIFILLTGIAQARTITLSPCDQNGMNAALDAVYNEGGGEVYLNPGVYDITGPIYIGTNTKFWGDPNAIIRVSSSSSHWFTNAIGIINAIGILNNVEICGFQIDGNCENLPVDYSHTRTDTAHDCESAIHLSGDSNNFMNRIKIHDMLIYDTFSDGVTIRFCNYADCFNNLISNCEHEGVFYVCAIDSLIENNRIAGITSDCLRLDNCANCKVENNILYSYSGDHSTTYMHGENGLQIGDGGVSHGYDARNKPTSTKNIEVNNNTFANNGLQAILLDSIALTESANVFIHDNNFIDEKELTTMGIPVGDFNYTNMPSLETSEKVFSSIFDILNSDLTYTGRTQQPVYDIPYTVKQTENGIIAGGIKIIGFKDEITWCGKTYIPDENSILVKAVAVKSPSLNFFSYAIDHIDKNITLKIENGTTIATMTITSYYYATSMNKKTGKYTKGNIHVATATFNDSCPAPEVLVRPKNITCIVYVYPTYFIMSVPSQGLVKVHYEYYGVSTDHFYAIGEIHNGDKGVKYTNFTNLEYWKGDYTHQGNWLTILGEFDQSKLNVTVTTPYEDLQVTDFKIINKDIPSEIIAWWFYPSIGLLAVLFLYCKYYYRFIERL